MTQTERPRVTVPALRQMKTRGERIAMVSAYDAAFARMFDEAGVDALLVGDTLGRARGRGRRHRVAALARHAVGHWAAHRGSPAAIGSDRSVPLESRHSAPVFGLVDARGA
ncbi:MAG: 3-methyl-2-oxobutanoate hydroxymethyltransferase [Labilithrix sp.]|nr:3-methyl-2-oxobutanoate hydroxymethyltransferase [Labilithrix sp.]